MAALPFYSSVFRCSATAGPSVSGHCTADAGFSSRKQRSSTVGSKYDRIVAFVDAHATPVVPVPGEGSSFSSEEFEPQLPSWHNSYDEEAEEGGLCDEPHLLAYTPAVSAQAAGHVAAMAASAVASSASSTAVLVHSWSYGNAENPKPWCYSWDEEAEGSFELADCRQTAQQAREQRRAALHEARHAARVNRKMRRATLHPQLGDLEHMQAWVGEQPRIAQQQQGQQQRSIPNWQYQQLLALVAGDSTHRQYRKPKAWHLTFDEECHGDAPETVLGSC